MKPPFPPRRILVAADLSKPSAVAVAAAKSLAKRLGAALELVYAEDLPLSLLGLLPDGEAYSVEELAKQTAEFRRWREEKLRELAGGAKGKPVQVRTLKGFPPKILAELADGRTAGLVVMGTHGYAGFERLMFGSVAEAVVRRARVPVLTVPPSPRTFAPRRILVPVNLEPYADQALDYALRLAGALKARVEVLFVAAPGHWPLDAKEEARRHLAKAFGKAGARLPIRIRFGDPRHEILADARQGRFDLIVLSAHRRPFWGGFALGSTAERVLRHCPVPVLSVPSVGRPRRQGKAADLAVRPMTRM